MKQDGTPSLYGCLAKLKDNAADCKPKPHHQYHKRLIKHMVLKNISVFNGLFTGNSLSLSFNKDRFELMPLRFLPACHATAAAPKFWHRQ
jgi:hypothetical protein